MQPLFALFCLLVFFFCLLSSLLSIIVASWRPSPAPPPLASSSTESNATTDDTQKKQEKKKSFSKESLVPPVLAFCTGSRRLYFWNPTTGISWADLPPPVLKEKEESLAITYLQWSVTGSFLSFSLLLFSSLHNHDTCFVP